MNQRVKNLERRAAARREPAILVVTDSPEGLRNLHTNELYTEAQIDAADLVIRYETVPRGTEAQ
jgi:hypothetical protein